LAPGGDSGPVLDPSNLSCSRFRATTILS
jgi:hypothetical protein